LGGGFGVHKEDGLFESWIVTYIIFKCFVPDYPDYAAANYEEGNYEDTTVKYEQDDDRYRDGEEENETNARNYNNEYEGEDY
jgi:hypothetical protein